MRFLFPHPGLLTYGNHEGGIKSYRALVAALAANGHECEVVSIPSTVEGSDPSEWHRLCSISPAGVDPNPIGLTLSRRLPIAQLRSARGHIAGQVWKLLRIRAEFGALVKRRIQQW